MERPASCDYLNSASAGPKDALVLDDMIMPTMIPKSPRAEPKISMIRILTNMRGSCASDRAQAEPTTPTQIPQKKVGKADSDASPEKAVSAKVHVWTSFALETPVRDAKLGVVLIGNGISCLDLSGANDRDNHTVNGKGFAENNANEILRLDPRNLDGSTDERTSGQEDAPCRAQHRHAKGESDTEETEENWADVTECIRPVHTIRGSTPVVWGTAAVLNTRLPLRVEPFWEVCVCTRVGGCGRSQDLTIGAPVRVGEILSVVRTGKSEERNCNN